MGYVAHVSLVHMKKKKKNSTKINIWNISIWFYGCYETLFNCSRKFKNIVEIFCQYFLILVKLVKKILLLKICFACQSFLFHQ